MKMKYTILRKPFAWQYLMPNMIEDFNIEIEQANKLNTVCNMSAFNSTGLQELKKIADKYHQISNDFKIVVDKVFTSPETLTVQKLGVLYDAHPALALPDWAS